MIETKIIKRIASTNKELNSFTGESARMVKKEEQIFKIESEIFRFKNSR